MPSRRILLVSFIPKQSWTGMGRWTHQMVTGLKEAGYDAEAWYDSDFPGCAGSGRRAVLMAPLAMAYRLIRERETIEAVVIHEPLGFWYGILRRLWTSLPPMLVMCHNVESRFFGDMQRFAKIGMADRQSPFRAPLLRHWQSNGSIILADHVVCLSQADRAYIAGPLGVATELISVMTNGVSPGDFVEITGSGTENRVLWIGGWLDVKGRRTLPTLWHAVRREIPQAELTVVGTGASEEDVLEAFERPDRKSVVVIPRVRERDEMRRHFANHDMFLLTSLSEGSPLAVLEAMAAGLPIVAARTGGVPDLLEGAAEALLYDPANPLEGAERVIALMHDTPRARALGAAARDRATLLPWSATAGTLIAAIAATLQREVSE